MVLPAMLHKAYTEEQLLAHICQMTIVIFFKEISKAVTAHNVHGFH